MLSAAVLIAPGCDREAAPESRSDPVRQAVYRALAAQRFVQGCPGSAGRRETAYQDERLEELKQLAARKGAGRAVGLGENDWRAVARYDRRSGCRPGEVAYREALAGYAAALDGLAIRTAEHPR